MSNASLPSDSLDESTTTDQRFAARLRRLPATFVATGRAAGFWTAVGLPFLYPPLLVAGLNGPQDLVLFLGLLVVNVAALIAGRSHRRE